MLRKFIVSSMAAGLVLSTVALPAAGQEASEGFLACPDGAPRAPFDDVETRNVHARAIDCGFQVGLVNGVRERVYAPARSVTRGQIASLLARTLEEADIVLPEASDGPDFPDLEPTHGDNVRRLAAVGVIGGYVDGTFRPSDAIRRDQLASVLVRAMSYIRGGTLVPLGDSPFGDVSSRNVHLDNVIVSNELGLLRGRSETVFAPARDTRRDQAASVAVRKLDALIEETTGAFDLTILHNNDGESALIPDAESGDPGVAAYIGQLDALRSAAVSSLDAGGHAAVTVSAGDSFLAGPQLAASLEDPDSPFYDALVYVLTGYDAVTIGNHEFDFGPDLLVDFIEAAEGIPFISANLDVSEEPALAALEDTGQLAASTVVQRSGRTIGIVGATTELLPTISSPRNAVVTDVFEAVQDEVDTLRADGVDVVLLSSHLQDLDNEIELAGQFSGLDAIVGGGGGEDLGEDYPIVTQDADGNDVPVVTVPGAYRDVGKLVLEFDAEGDLTIGDGSELRDVDPDGVRSSLAQQVIEAPVEAFVAELAANVIAQTEVPLDARRQGPGVRDRETNAGDLLADALLTTARDNADEFGAPVADIALQNGGGIRIEAIVGEDATADAPADISELTTFQIAPFSNFVSVSEIDVDTLRSALERSVASLPGANGAHGQWAGIEFRFDLTEAPQVVDGEGGIVTEGERIAEATVTLSDGEELVVVEDGETQDYDGTIAIASNDFTLRGGDQYPFSNEEFPLTNVGATYQQALSSLIADLGVITAADYPDLSVNEDRYRRFGPVDGEFIE